MRYRLSPEEKKAAREKVKNALKVRKELRKNVAEKARIEHLGVREERLEERLGKIPADKRAKVKVRVDKAINKLKRVGNKLKDKIESNREKLAKIKQDVKAKKASVREDFKERKKQIKAKVEEKKQDIKDRKAKVVSSAEAKKAARQGTLQANTGGGEE